MHKPAVILLSGGIDSAATLAIAREDGFIPHAISFRYGQRNIWELDSAKRLAEAMSVRKHLIVDVDLEAIGGSALTAKDIAVPKQADSSGAGGRVPVTYVPARNLIFLSLGLAWAETLNASDLFIGVHSSDYSGYPDCRSDFIASFERTANLGTRAGVGGRSISIRAPLIGMTKAEIIRRGTELGVDFSLSRSCYDPDQTGRACGRCDSCRLRKKGFSEAGIADPTTYQE